MDDGPEVFGEGIARTTDGEFLLYKQFGLEGNLRLGIANEHHSSGEAHLVDGQGIGGRTAYRFNHHIGPKAVCDFLQALVYVFFQGIDGVGGTHFTGQSQLLVVQIDGYDGGASQGSTDNGSHAHHTTTNDHHYIDIGYTAIAYRMEPYTHGFYQRTIAGTDVRCRNNLFPGHYQIVGHGSVALYTQCLVMLAGIEPTVAARSAFATVGVRVHGDYHARL